MQNKLLYLDDLKVGDCFKSRGYTITLGEILSFAEKYDPQPFHLDEKQAQDHPIFQGIAASGWHTAAITMRLWSECMPIANGLIGSEVHLNWPRPTRAGDTLHVEVEIINIRPSNSRPDRGMVTYQTKVYNQHAEVLMNSSTTILVFKQQVDI